MIFWDLYEIRCSEATLHGVKLRGRIRKFTIENDILCLAENAQDEENVVRFGVLAGSDLNLLTKFIEELLPQATISTSIKNVPNPVLSKMKVNDLSRYEV